MTEEKNLTLLCDFYEYTMANGYIEAGMGDRIAYFDMFFRNVPDDGGFAIMAGVEQMADRIRNMRFTSEDIDYFQSKGVFGDRFLDYLAHFKFKGDVWAVPEGTPIFPMEPIVTVRAPAPQAQMLETLLLLTINHQSLIATKANRIVRAAAGRGVAEFGSRRAQGSEAAILGARAAYIGGCVGTACTISDRDYGIPASGTMAHSWVLMFPSEYDAFIAYCKLYPNNAVLLVDTYDALGSGVPAAIRAFKDCGITKGGIRLDSGDLAFLTRKAREMLDAAGLPGIKIVASNSLDEYLIKDLIDQGACIDSFGVGDRLITSHSNPVFGGVYKLAAAEEDGRIVPKIKISNNVSKITTPGYKKVYRFFGKDNGKALADLVCLADEKVDEDGPLTIFDPAAPWKKKTLRDYTVRELQTQIFRNGEQVYKSPSLKEIRDYCKNEVDNTLWDETKRFSNPQTYYVDLSEKLWKLKRSMLDNAGAPPS
jgi:nicotinate phosphoribosyltransferase